MAPVASPEKHNNIPAVRQSGYSIGYGFNKAEAYGDAVANLPKGVTSWPARFIKVGPNSYKCIIKWEK